MSVTSRSTKAQLLAHIVGQDAALLAQGHTIRALRDELAMARPAPSAPAPAAHAAELRRLSQESDGVGNGPLEWMPETPRDTHTAYYAYVKAQRQAAKTSGSRVTSYKSFTQWSATGSAPSVRVDNFAACELDLINLRADRAATWSVA